MGDVVVCYVLTSQTSRGDWDDAKDADVWFGRGNAVEMRYNAEV